MNLNAIILVSSFQMSFIITLNQRVSACALFIILTQMWIIQLNIALQIYLYVFAYMSLLLALSKYLGSTSNKVMTFTVDLSIISTGIYIFQV